MTEKKPKPLEGWLEKKGTGKIHMGGDWQKRYLRIDEANAALTYSKSSDSREKVAGSIDFKLVGEIVPHSGKSGQQDFTRFDIDIGDKVSSIISCPVQNDIIAVHGRYLSSARARRRTDEGGWTG